MTFNKTLVLVAGMLTSFSLVAWDGELIEITKGNKSVSFMIRYYSGQEWNQINNLLDLEGFRKSSNQVRIKSNNDELCICAPDSYVYSEGDSVCEKFRRMLNEKGSREASGLIWEHSRLRVCETRMPEISGLYNKISTIWLVEKNYVSKTIFRFFWIEKRAMQRLAAEDPAISYKATRYENGEIIGWHKFRKQDGHFYKNYEYKPAINFWTFLKVLFLNEECLYAFGALSALYLGYEYLKQR